MENRCCIVNVLHLLNLKRKDIATCKKLWMNEQPQHIVTYNISCIKYTNYKYQPMTVSQCHNDLVSLKQKYKTQNSTANSKIWNLHYILMSLCIFVLNKQLHKNGTYVLNLQWCIIQLYSDEKPMFDLQIWFFSTYFRSIYKNLSFTVTLGLWFELNIRRRKVTRALQSKTYPLAMSV